MFGLCSVDRTGHVRFDELSMEHCDYRITEEVPGLMVVKMDGSYSDRDLSLGYPYITKGAPGNSSAPY